MKADHVRRLDLVTLVKGCGELYTVERVTGSVVVCTRLDHTGQVVRNTFNAAMLLVVWRPQSTGR